jgi:hypothetical protein
MQQSEESNHIKQQKFIAISGGIYQDYSLIEWITVRVTPAAIACLFF